MLAIESRESRDLKSLGELFFYCCDELDDIKLFEAYVHINPCYNRRIIAPHCPSRSHHHYIKIKTVIAFIALPISNTIASPFSPYYSD